ncbi:ABC transporter permease [Actinoplanes derwentensis]|uniref:Transport permease protein n=1 Tax=Actinoplanes derwentensis TaxID=113562 RepID=A0A1H1QA76_9ACTN|nr:ABC transporter permease [Actinoplanes derwentensis]GID82196.1 transport permease protein [Actinoplanes derwentensis]SDS20187.1 ABC transporter efflux protein, DrrB family [Actinoplanes derwentensis]
MTAAFADGRVMAGRYLRHVVRAPEEIVIYFALPIMFVLVFGYVFGSGMSVPGGGHYREFLIPGVFVMTMFYGIGATGTSIAVDLNRGVVDRFRSMPIARSALITGRMATDQARALLETTVLIVCGLLVGWRWHLGVPRLLAGIGLLLLLRLALSCVGMALGMVAKNPDTVATIVFPLAFPLSAVSNVFVAPELMPGWLGVVSEWNPVSATTTAIRELFGNPGIGSDSWPAEHALLLAVGWPLALIMIFGPLAVRQYRNLGS